MGRRSEHVYGPTKHGKRWRLTFVAGDGRRSVESFASEGECAEAIGAYRARLAGTQVSDAIAEFLDAELERGLRAGTVATLGYRLRAVLQVDAKRTGGPVADLTPARARRLLEGYEAAVDTRKGALAACRAFGAHCVARRYVRVDPFKDCKVVGQKKRGKPQLSIDEGRLFFATALEKANAGDVAALGVLLSQRRAAHIFSRIRRSQARSGLASTRVEVASRHGVEPEPWPLADLEHVDRRAEHELEIEAPHAGRVRAALPASGQSARLLELLALDPPPAGAPLDPEGVAVLAEHRLAVLVGEHQAQIDVAGRGRGQHRTDEPQRATVGHREAVRVRAEPEREHVGHLGRRPRLVLVARVAVRGHSTRASRPRTDHGRPSLVLIAPVADVDAAQCQTVRASSEAGPS